MKAKLYIAHRVMKYNNRPVHKVEVIEETATTVTFETDYPVERITIPAEEFYKYFYRWQ